MNLPWPEVALPMYSPGRRGRWEVKYAKGAIPGYFTLKPVPMSIPVLSRIERGKPTVWMSLANMERESHMPHIEAAHGHTVVMGLGMGMYLYNIMRKPDVTRITVVERDKHILELLREVAAFDDWEGIEKVKIVIGDARTWLPSYEHPVDFLYADIWKLVGDSKANKDIKAMAANIKPGMLGYWTQEFDFVDYMRLRKIPYEDVTGEHVKEFAEKHIGCPVVGMYNLNYHLMAVIAVLVQAAANEAKVGNTFLLSLLKLRIDQLYNKVNIRNTL